MPQVAPKISVAIVTFNRREQVSRAIDSVMSQWRDDIEIVVVDNNSSDGTADHVASAFPGVRLIRLARNVGCPDGRNHAYANCRGDYIINLDDDGWLSQGVFEPLLDVFSQDERIGIVALRQEFPDEHGDSTGRAMSAGVQDVGLFSGGVSAFRRSMVEQSGGYPHDFFLFAEEAYLAIRALDAGFRIVSAPHIVMWHPRVGGSGRGGAADFHLYRNLLLVILRLYPVGLFLKYFPLRAGNLLIKSLQRRTFAHFCHALSVVLLQLPGTLATRKPASVRAVSEHLRARQQSHTFTRSARGMPTDQHAMEAVTK